MRSSGPRAPLRPSNKGQLREVDRLQAPAKGRFRTKLTNNNKQKNYNKFINSKD